MKTEAKSKKRLIVSYLLVFFLLVATNLFTFYYEEFKFGELAAEKGLFYIWGTVGSPLPWNVVGAKIYFSEELINAPE
jgi:hypothetical protein